MARPLLKGPPRSFRLPLAEDEALAAAARRQNLTITAYVERLVTRHLTPVVDRPRDAWNASYPR